MNLTLTLARHQRVSSCSPAILPDSKLLRNCTWQSYKHVHLSAGVQLFSELCTVVL